MMDKQQVMKILADSIDHILAKTDAELIEACKIADEQFGDDSPMTTDEALLAKVAVFKPRLPLALPLGAFSKSDKMEKM